MFGGGDVDLNCRGPTSLPGLAGRFIMGLKRDPCCYCHGVLADLLRAFADTLHGDSAAAPKL
jgi:hypothetical protein